MVRLIIIILFLITICPLVANAQDEMCLGKIIDGETGSPISLATVVVLSKSLGAISDSTGCFRLQTVSLKGTDSIRISYVGYKPLSILLSSLKVNNKIMLMPESKMLDGVIVQGIEFHLDEFMKEVSSVYQLNRRKTAHIAKSTFEQYGKVDADYVQYTISSGYTIYFGDKSNVTKLALYSFVPEKTNKSLRRPEWLKSSKQYRNERTDLPFMGEVGFNSYQYFEEIGPLSNYVNKYKFKLDSVFQVGSEEVYKVSFNAKPAFDIKARFMKGYIMVYANSKRLVTASVLGKLLWSTVLHERVMGKLQYEFVYYNDQPFLFRINTQYEKKKIEERTVIKIDLQKFDVFEVDVDQLFAIRTLGWNPIIVPDSALSERASLGINFDQLRDDLGYKGTLWEQFVSSSGQSFWEYTITGMTSEIERKDKARELIIEYKKFF